MIRQKLGIRFCRCAQTSNYYNLHSIQNSLGHIRIDALLLHRSEDFLLNVASISTIEWCSAHFFGYSIDSLPALFWFRTFQYGQCSDGQIEQGKDEAVEGAHDEQVEVDSTKAKIDGSER